MSTWWQWRLDEVEGWTRLKFVVRGFELAVALLVEGVVFDGR